MRKLILALCVLVSTPATAAESSAPVIEYIFGLVDVQTMMREAAARETQAEPEVREFALRAVSTFDVRSLLDQESELIERMVPAEGAGACLAFVRSPLAARVTATVRRHQSLPAAIAEMERFPLSERQAIAEFLDADCFRNSLAAIQSAEFQDAARLHGAALACTQLGIEAPEKFEAMRSLGHCSAPPK